MQLTGSFQFDFDLPVYGGADVKGWPALSAACEDLFIVGAKGGKRERLSSNTSLSLRVPQHTYAKSAQECCIELRENWTLSEDADL